MRTTTSVCIVVTTLLASLSLRADPPARAVDTAYKEAKQAFGTVPGFMKAVPEEALPGAWDQMTALEMSNDTALSGKVKELISLAVSAQIPCRYCVYADTQFARAAGASDRELHEAVAMAALTRQWSTVLNGMQIDPALFDKEIAGIVAYLRKGTKPVQGAPITDAASAYHDMEQTLGTIPSFLRAFPSEAVAPAWRQTKEFQMGSTTALDGKTKELIGLAVAAQIPCKYCIAFHTQAAKLNGASEDEIKEAVAMAATTRYWSTIVNGANPDENQFRKEVDQAVKNMKKPQRSAAR